MSVVDPFIYCPDLRDKILEPTKSSFRELDLDRLDDTMREAGAPTDWRFSCEYREASRQKILKGRWNQDLWVFAYASLIWDPAFYFDEIRMANLSGFHRRFCLRSVIGRGTPSKPGLVAGLDEGGECQGLVYRLRKSRIEEETKVIWRREMLLHAYKPTFLQMDTEQGTVEALAFIADHNAANYLADMTIDETAHYMATGVGSFGSSLEYLEKLAYRFEVLGFKDEALFSLRDRAREIAKTS